MRSGGDCGVRRSRAYDLRRTRIALEWPALDGVHRIVDGQMHHRESNQRARWHLAADRDDGLRGVRVPVEYRVARAPPWRESARPPLQKRRNSNSGDRSWKSSPLMCHARSLSRERGRISAHRIAADCLEVLTVSGRIPEVTRMTATPLYVFDPYRLDVRERLLLRGCSRSRCRPSSSTC